MAKVSMFPFTLPAEQGAAWAARRPQQPPLIKRAASLLCAAVEATIKFTYVEKYPDEPPLWEIHSQENLEDSHAEDILALLQQQVGPRGRLLLSYLGRWTLTSSV